MIYFLTADIILTSSLDGAQAACPVEVVTYTCTALRTTAIEWIVTPGSLSAVFFQDSTITEKKREGFQLALTSRIPNGTGTSDLTSTLTVNTTASQNGTLIQCVSDNGRAKLELRVVTSKLPILVNSSIEFREQYHFGIVISSSCMNSYSLCRLMHFVIPFRGVKACQVCCC